MKLFVKSSITLLFFLFFTINNIDNAFASTIFEDDFNSYDDGSFPTKWMEFNNPGENKCSNVQWKVQNGMVGANILNQGSCVVNIIPNDLVWPTLSSEYIFDVDMYFKQGSDHNIAYKVFPDIHSLVELHFVNGDFGISHWGGNIIYDNPTDYYSNRDEKYHFKIIVKNTDLKVYIDNVLAKELEIIYPLPAGKIGLRVGTGADPNSETWFDNVKVTTLDDSTSLNVPLLKQTDPLWINDLYDSANLWSTGETNTGRWGCALTSAAMVLKYNNINKLPNDQDLTPSTLNTWLKLAPDGYVRNGLVNWLAIQRMTLLSKINNPTFGYDALEYTRVSGLRNDLLTNDINNKIPGILEEPGHFVVATGNNGTSYSINDPYYDRSTLSDYGNTYNSYGKYIPSNTDLSYLMFVVDSNTNLLIQDQNGVIVGDYFTQNPIMDPLMTLSNSVGPLKTVLLPKPINGKYSVKVSSTNSTKYFLQGYLYDTNGNVKILEQKDVLSNNDTDTFNFNFIKDGNSNTVLSENVTFTTIKNDLDAFYLLKLLKKEFYKKIKEKINETEKQSNKGKKSIINKLNELMKEIRKEKKLDIYVSSVLQNDIQSIINSLPQLPKVSPTPHREQERESERE